MVGGYYNNGCTCGGGTSTTATYNHGGTSATASDNCGCCQGYEYATLTSIPVMTEEEIVIAEKPPPRWDIVRTVLYVILRLRHYIEKVARPPPNEDYTTT